MDVYTQASASHFGSQCGNIHGTQARGAALRCSLWRSDELGMLKRCLVLAEVDNGDISSTHKLSVIGAWGGALCKTAIGMEKWWVVLLLCLRSSKNRSEYRLFYSKTIDETHSVYVFIF